MKILFSIVFCYYAFFAMFGNANAVPVPADPVPTVFTPTDGNVNILDLALFGGGFNPGQFAALTQPMDLSGNFPQNPVLPLFFGSDNSLTIPTSVLTTVGFPAFSVAVYDGMDWHYEDGIEVFPSGNGAVLTFDWNYGAVSFERVDLALTDASATPVDVGVVPVPAAVWLFGTGLLGIVGVGRTLSA